MGLLVWITQTLSNLGYSGVFVLMGLESAGAPIPAEIVLPFGGYLVYQHRMSLVGMLVAANLGGLVGFLFQYALGRLGGRPLVQRYGPYLLISAEHISRADRWFAEHGPRAVFVARMLPVVRGLISLPAGAAEMRLLPFLLWSLTGAFPWTLGLIGAGWAAGTYWSTVTQWAHRTGLYVLLGAIPIGGAWMLRKRRLTAAAAARPATGNTAATILGKVGPITMSGAITSVKQRARRLKSETHALYLASRDPRVPWYAKVAAVGVAAYALSPIDLIPDFIPVLGYLDDVIIVPAGIAFALRLVPADVMADCRAKAQAAQEGRPKNWVVAGIIVAIWAAVLAWSGIAAIRYFRAYSH